VLARRTIVDASLPSFVYILPLPLPLFSFSFLLPSTSPVDLSSSSSSSSSLTLNPKPPPTQTSAQVDVIAGDIVPQLQQHTEQLTNVYALVDKMAEHMSKVKESVATMDRRLEAAEAAHAGSLAKSWNALLGKNPAPEMPQEPVNIVSVDDFFSSLKV
jgi:small-conductance mechanosensitive channel